MKILNSISLRIILQRLLISLGVILFIRVGSFLPIPGINHTDLALYIQNNPFARNIVSTFSGKDTFVIEFKRDQREFRYGVYKFDCVN